MSAVSPARDVAAKVLARVTRDQAFAAAALDTEAQRAKLEPRDARLATELVYGVLRVERFLLDVGARLSAKGRLPDKPVARAHILIGLYSLAFLDRLPPHAVVSEAVNGVRAELGEGPSRFVNALLRTYAREIEAKGRPSLTEAIAKSLPDWLRASLARSLGAEEAERYWSAGPIPPPLAVALADASRRDEEIERLRASAPPGADIRAGALSPRAILLTGAGDPRKLPGFEADWIVQEEGAQALALALGATPGATILDACAGRGNKTWLLAKLAGESGQVIACDLHAAKLEKLTARIPNARAFAVDWTIGPGDVPADADLVLVDAPCSGTGTMRRRPDLLRRLEEADVARLAEKQVAITLTAATRTKPGSTLVYAVCSVLREECEEVVEALARGSDEIALEPIPFGDDAPAPMRGERSLRLLPHVHGTDGYFLAAFRVTKR